MNKTLGGLIGLVVVLVIGLITFFSFCGIEYIKGHELAIKEEWGGVDKTGGPNRDGVYGSGKRIFFRPTTDYVKYDMRRHHYKMVDEEASQGDDPADGPSYVFQVDGGQDVKVGFDIVWRYDAKALQQLHQDVRNEVPAAERKILANPCKRIAQNLVTTNEALKIYYGEGLVGLQELFKDRLMSDSGVAAAGIIIEDTVVFTELHPDYKKQIHDKVVAEQKEIAQAQLEKANIAESKAAKAFAEIDKNKRVIAAEAAKQEKVLAAEAENERTILAAQAEQQKRVLEAEGERDAMIAQAKGIEAKKLAEAKGEEALKLAMYDGVAGERRAAVEKVGLQAEKLKGMLQGNQVIPEKAFMALMNSATDVTPILDVAAAAADTQ